MQKSIKKVDINGDSVIEAEIGNGEYEREQENMIVKENTTTITT